MLLVSSLDSESFSSLFVIQHIMTGKPLLILSLCIFINCFIQIHITLSRNSQVSINNISWWFLTMLSQFRSVPSWYVRFINQHLFGVIVINTRICIKIWHIKQLLRIVCFKFFDNYISWRNIHWLSLLSSGISNARHFKDVL